MAEEIDVIERNNTWVWANSEKELNLLTRTCIMTSRP